MTTAAGSTRGGEKRGVAVCRGELEWLRDGPLVLPIDLGGNVEGVESKTRLIVIVIASACAIKEEE